MMLSEVQEAGGKEEDGGAGLRILLQQAERKVGTMLRESKAQSSQRLNTYNEEIKDNINIYKCVYHLYV